jgi:hypothetical protein
MESETKKRRIIFFKNLLELIEKNELELTEKNKLELQHNTFKEKILLERENFNNEVVEDFEKAKYGACLLSCPYGECIGLWVNDGQKIRGHGDGIWCQTKKSLSKIENLLTDIPAPSYPALIEKTFDTFYYIAKNKKEQKKFLTNLQIFV